MDFFGLAHKVGVEVGVQLAIARFQLVADHLGHLVVGRRDRLVSGGLSLNARFGDEDVKPVVRDLCAKKVTVVRRCDILVLPTEEVD